MIEKFNELTPREKILYIVSFAAIFLVLYFLVLIMPVKGKISRAQKQLAATEANWSKFQTALGEYRALPAADTASRSGSLLSNIETIVQKTALSDSVSYLKPFTSQKSAEGAEIKLDNISGESLLSFLHEAQQKQIKVVKANLTDNDLDGLWTVKLFLEI